MTEQDINKKYVVQKHLTLPYKGICFFARNTKSGRQCHSNKGELWYKNVGFADTIEEAQTLIGKYNVYPFLSRSFN